jgi:hypothetical protein
MEINFEEYVDTQLAPKSSAKGNRTFSCLPAWILVMLIAS